MQGKPDQRPAAPSDDDLYFRRPLVEATIKELDAVGVLDTSAGQVAIALAKLADGSMVTDAARVAALKALPAAMQTAMNSVKRADQVDEVAKRRDAKLAAIRQA